MTATRILLTGGGTGGHVYPALAVVACARETAEPSVEFLYVGTTSGLERDIVDRAGLPFEAVDAGAIRGRSPLAAATGMVRNVRGIFRASAILRRFRPDAVLATGGFVCVPVVCAAWLVGIPTVIYLPDLRPGWAVRFLARVATVVAVSFEEVRPFIPSRRVEVTGYPVRPALLLLSRNEARQALDLEGDDPVVLVMGGSRGARSINDAIGRDLETLLQRAVLIHASGATSYPALASRRAALPEQLRERYRLFPYLADELAPAMAAASLVVSRSGASALGELPAVGAPGLLIPYPHAGAHQRFNAEFLSRRGVVDVLDDAAVQRGELVSSILALLADSDKLGRMADAARRLACPDAASRLLQLVTDHAIRRAGKMSGRFA